MNKITTQMLADTTAERYKASQCVDGKWTYGDKRREMYEAIKALNPVTPQAVNEILGNSTWTSIRCDECMCNVDVAVSFDVPEYGYDYCICANCLVKALLL